MSSSKEKKKRKKKRNPYVAFELFVALAHQRRLFRRVEKVKHNAALHHLAVKDVGLLRQLDVCKQSESGERARSTTRNANDTQGWHSASGADSAEHAPANDGSWSHWARDELPEKRDDDDEYWRPLAPRLSGMSLRRTDSRREIVPLTGGPLLPTASERVHVLVTHKTNSDHLI